MSSSTNKTTSRYQLEIRRDKCISAASCVAIAPETFKLDEKEIVKIIDPQGNDSQTQLLAAQSCPTGAIVVKDAETGETVWPKVE